MEYKALRTFLHKGEVVEEGSAIELPDHEAHSLLRFGRVSPVGGGASAAEVSLNELTKEALLGRCLEAGIEAKPTMKKDELIALLTAKE